MPTPDFNLRSKRLIGETVRRVMNAPRDADGQPMPAWSRLPPQLVPVVIGEARAGTGWYDAQIYNALAGDVDPTAAVSISSLGTERADCLVMNLGEAGGGTPLSIGQITGAWFLSTQSDGTPVLVIDPYWLPPLPRSPYQVLMPGTDGVIVFDYPRFA